MNEEEHLFSLSLFKFYRKKIRDDGDGDEEGENVAEDGLGFWRGNTPK